MCASMNRVAHSTYLGDFIFDLGFGWLQSKSFYIWRYLSGHHFTKWHSCFMSGRSGLCASATDCLFCHFVLYFASQKITVLKEAMQASFHTFSNLSLTVHLIRSGECNCNSVSFQLVHYSEFSFLYGSSSYCCRLLHIWLYLYLDTLAWCSGARAWFWVIMKLWLHGTVCCSVCF